MDFKTVFFEVLSKIKQQQEYIKELDDIFHNKLNNDFVYGAAFVGSDFQSYVIQLLDNHFGDECDWVAYWVYELDCGENYEDGSVLDNDGAIIKLKTIDDLWTFCNKEFKGE